MFCKASLVLVFLLIVPVLAQRPGKTYSISITETLFDRPEDAIPFIEKAINNNDSQALISCFPLSEEMNSLDFKKHSLWLGSASVFSNPYFPGFEQSLLIRLMATHGTNYAAIKGKLLEAYLPENLQGSVNLTTDKDIDTYKSTV